MPPSSLERTSTACLTFDKLLNLHFPVTIESDMPPLIMPDISRKKTLDELKSEAIAKLERLGYDVRGKTPAQIRQMLKARSPRPKAAAKSSVQTMGISHVRQN
jgi:hypothetical protein